MPDTQTTLGLRVLQQLPEGVSSGVGSGVQSRCLVCGSTQGREPSEREDSSKEGESSLGSGVIGGFLEEVPFGPGWG